MWASSIAAALRRMARDRMHAGVTILALALGFTAAILIAVFVHDEYSYDRQWPAHERLYQVLELRQLGGGIMFPQFRIEIARRIELGLPEAEVITLAPRQPILSHNGVSAVEDGFVWADPNIFDLFPPKVIAGDPKATLARADGLVLTRSAARKYFGQDKPVGQTLDVDPALKVTGLPPYGRAAPMTVGAVIEDLPSETTIAATAFGSSLATASPQQDFAAAEGDTRVYVYARLKPGVRLAQAALDLDRLIDQVKKDSSSQASGSPPPLATYVLRAPGLLHLAPKPVVIRASVFSGHVLPGMKPPGDSNAIDIIGALGGLILLIAGLNFIALTTARGAARAMEVGIRKAVGAHRRDLIVQFVGEAMLTALIAFLLALALAEIALPSLNRILGRTMSIGYVSDPGLIASLLAGAVAIGLLAGLYPALVLSRFKPAAALRGGSGATTGSAMVRQGLVAGQFAILVGLALVTGTFLAQARHAQDAAVRQFGAQMLDVRANCTEAVLDRWRAIPGVAGINGASTQGNNHTIGTFIVGADGQKVPIETAPVAPGELEFFGYRPLAGRFFSPSPSPSNPLDPPQNGEPVIINEQARETLGYARPADAIGRTVRVNPGDKDYSARLIIIGVIPNKLSRTPAVPTLYFRSAENSGCGAVKLSGADPQRTIHAMEAVWRDMGNPRPLDWQFVSDEVRDQYKDVIQLGQVAAAGAGVALAIACLGIFALSAFLSELRTKEIGVRKAMGARTRDVLILMLWQFSRPVVVGVLIAWAVSYAGLTWWLRGFADPAPLSPWIFLAAGAAALVIAWATVFVHALSVARAKPVTALRYE